MRLALALVALQIACGDNTSGGEPELGPVTDPIEWVDPTIGSGGFGFAYGSAFPGAAAPHGMVKLGPDTSGEFGTIAFQHFSGYYAGDDVVETFSHMHLHGAGATDYGLIGVMPTTGFDLTKTEARDYRSSFEKVTEDASPGRYAVTLDSGVDVELVATPRAAHHRYDFGGSEGTLVIDLLRTLTGGEVTEPILVLDEDAQTIAGSLHHEGGMSGGFGGYDVFFAARTRAPWLGADTWDGGVALHFAAGQPVELQIGLSLVSAEGALANLEAELPAWDIEATAAATEQSWREILEAVIVEGGTAESRRILYSALYRSFLMPTITSDVDGSYLYGGETGVMDRGSFVSDLSLWDTYRTLHPLYHLLAPSSGADAARSLVAMSDVGRGFPRWPVATGESGTMLGASADVVLADAALKLDPSSFDRDAAFERLVDIATNPDLPREARGGRNPADEYMELGYVPSTVGRSVSTNLEFAVDDFALARFAESLGRTDEAALFDARAGSFRQLFDPATQTFRPRTPAGAFPDADGYDPLDFGDEFAEANAEQMMWAPLHDVAGLAELLGGESAMVERLEAFFDNARLDLEANPIDEILANTGPRPHYWHGNEPDIHAAYLFGQLGRDDLTQIWLRWITDNLYSATPHGLAGNDDGGTLSSWYVWTAMGIYPIAGSNDYFVGMPLFRRMTIKTASGTVTIEAPGLTASSGGVTGVLVNGQALEAARLEHAELVGNATIRFDISEMPTAWSR